MEWKYKLAKNRNTQYCTQYCTSVLHKYNIVVTSHHRLFYIVTQGFELLLQAFISFKSVIGSSLLLNLESALKKKKLSVNPQT